MRTLALRFLSAFAAFGPLLGRHVLHALAQRGVATNEVVSIAKGLDAGERVVTEGGDRLREGARVQLAGDRPASGASGAFGGRRGASGPDGGGSGPRQRRQRAAGDGGG